MARQNIGRKQSKNYIEYGGPKAGDHRKLQSKDGFTCGQGSPETGQTLAGAKDKDRSQRQKDERQHHEHEHADTEWPHNIEATNMPHGWNNGTHNLVNCEPGNRERPEPLVNRAKVLTVSGLRFTVYG